MIKLEVRGDNDFLMGVISSLKMLGKKAMPSTHKAFKIAANTIIANQWREYALGGDIPGAPRKLKNPKGGYAAAIKTRQIGTAHFRVTNDSKVAPFLEYGTSELDMKKTHPYGDRSRVANKGTKKNPRWVPYVIIPFRWGTGDDESPGSFRNIIPKGIYQMIQSDMKAGRFIRTRISGTDKTESNFWGDEVQRNQYETETGEPGWGTRIEGIGGKIEGMVAMMAESGREKRRSNYFTFRIISADSPADSWIKPAQPALHITRHVVENTKDKVSDLVRMGMLHDLGRLGGRV